MRRGALAAFAAIGFAWTPWAAHAHGRPPQAAYFASAPWREARTVPDVVAQAERHLGQGNFIGLPGAWCADFVSAILRAVGRPPLPNRMAASALAYGPLELHPRPGDIAVIATRRGRYGHVGFVVADGGDAVEIISGNWSHRVARAWIPRRAVTAFVRV